jgi:hypothetical protein
MWVFHLATEKQNYKLMKTRNIIPVLIIILLNSCFPKEHLIFNNVPLDGRLEKFASELTKLGFAISDSTKKNEIILSGEFLSKDCKIHIFGTNINDLTYKAIVSMPIEVHDSLQSDFGKMQKLFSLKYGIGYSKYQQYKKRERLLYKVPPRDVRVGDFTKYTTDSGEITLEVKEGYISITYLDKLNNEIWKREIEAGQKKELNAIKIE